jgi:recombination protein RecT
MEKYEIAVADQKIKARFLEVVTEKDYNREINFAIQAIRGNDKLQTCDEQSIKNAIVNVALCGATLNPALQQAYLVPRKGKCCLDLSYRGLCKIAVDSDSVYDIDATAVFEGDEFHFEMGLNPILSHVPKMFDDDKGKKVVAVYAVATLHHGIKKFVVLDKEKIERARKSSQYDVVWKAHYDEMAKKTAVKLLYKLLPQTERMSTAVSVINEHEGLVAKDEAKAKDVMKRFGLEKKTEQEAETMFECPKGPSVTKSICNDCADKNAACPQEALE